jgi:hypothetical protein
MEDAGILEEWAKLEHMGRGRLAFTRRFALWA